MSRTKKIGLALSGGGYRATAYHIGTLKKLNELGILKRIDVISCISGGSILGAFYGLHKDDFDDFEKKAREAVRKNVIWAILSTKWFYSMLILVLSTGYIAFQLHTIFFILWIIFMSIFQFKLFPLSKFVIKTYNKFFYKGKVLADLPEKPLIAINATNMESGRQFTFSREKMSDSFYEYPKDKQDAILFNGNSYPIANAVAASTCVPFAFTPISIEKKYYVNSKDFTRVNPMLIDGGLYDNQGIHKLMQPRSSYECDYIIVSDAGNDTFETKQIKNQILLLKKSIDLLMNRIRNLQMSDSIYKKRQDGKRVVYQSLQWRIDNCIEGFYNNLQNGNIPQVVWQYHQITDKEITQKSKKEICEKLRASIEYDKIETKAPIDLEYETAFNVSTNLWPLKDKEIDALIKCASSITEIQIKLYFPDLVNSI